MCDTMQTPTQQATQQATQQVADSDVSSELNSSSGGGENGESKPWARLFPVGVAFHAVELRKDLTTFGRKPDCDVNLAKMDSTCCSASAYSSVHFTIKREFCIQTGAYAMLTDTSSNGTFVNGDKLGKGRVQALKNHAEIALAKKENKAYMFIDLGHQDEDKWPATINKKYTITKTLGTGAYGEVWLAFERSTCKKYAIKIISKKRLTHHGRNQKDLSSQIASEVEILKRLDHPCIIKIKEVFDSYDHVFIVLDLVEGGELYDKLVSIGKYDEPTAKLLFYQMLVATKYLHDMGISHRDLKPENILLKSRDANETLIKINDFGLSKFFSSDTVMRTFCGTMNYTAPEVFASCKTNAAYTNKVDNWSLGVILYICLAGYPPFDHDDRQLESQIRHGLYDLAGVYWSHVSEGAKDVVRRLLCVDPEKRASIDDILAHEWIRDDEAMKEKVRRLMQQEIDATKNTTAAAVDAIAAATAGDAAAAATKSLCDNQSAASELSSPNGKKKRQQSQTDEPTTEPVSACVEGYGASNVLAVFDVHTVGAAENENTSSVGGETSTKSEPGKLKRLKASTSSTDQSI